MIKITSVCTRKQSPFDESLKNITFRDDVQNTKATLPSEQILGVVSHGAERSTHRDFSFVSFVI